jgi:hypothetical protein
MEAFTQVFLTTTNPETSYTSLVTNPMVYVSVVFHTIVYTLVLRLLVPSIDWKFMASLLVIIMFSGYILRLWRLKALHTLRKTEDAKKDKDALVSQGRMQYFVWYFLG